MCEALQHIIASMPDTIFYRRDLVKDTYDYVSPTVKDILGLSPQELGKMKLTEVRDEIVHPEDRFKLHESLTHILRNKKAKEHSKIAIEYRIKCRDGNYRWVCEMLSVCSDENGMPVSVIGCVRDISETVRLREELVLCEERFRNLYHHAKAALFRGSIKNGRIEECNELFAWCLGFRNAQECKDGFTFEKDGTNHDGYKKLILDLCEAKAVNNREIQIRRKDESICWMNVSAFLCDGEYFDAVACDITAIKELTEAEAAVLKLLLTGLSNKEIAVRLKRSQRTVEQHRASIMAKLNAKNIVDLAMHYLIMMF